MKLPSVLLCPLIDKNRERTDIETFKNSLSTTARPLHPVGLGAGMSNQPVSLKGVRRRTIFKGK